MTKLLAMETVFTNEPYEPTAAEWAELSFARLLADIDDLDHSQLEAVREYATKLLAKPPANRIKAFLPPDEELPF